MHKKRILNVWSAAAVILWLGCGGNDLNAQDSNTLRRGTAHSSHAHSGHAHNDYLHRRPLLDAVDQGFGSVEADVFLVDGELLVGHTAAELSPERTLRAMYLDPLRQRIEQNGGSVHGDGRPLVLLIDFKSAGEPTYEALHRLLGEYADIFTSVEDGEVTQRAVTAIVSGNRPISRISAAPLRFVGIDGRLSDLNNEAPPHLMPLISDNWTQHFKWRGEGPLPEELREKLRKLVEEVHADGRLVRFWATPDQPAAWAALREAGVDLINTDDLEGLAEFLDVAK